MNEETKTKIVKTQKIKGDGIAILCESDGALQNHYSPIIKSVGLECKCVKTGYELYEQLSNSKCKLVVMDLMLSGEIDGLEVIKTIRKSLKLKFPIIVLTNMTSESIMKAAYAEGANNYLVKTDVEDDELRKAIKREMINRKAIGIILFLLPILLLSVSMFLAGLNYFKYDLAIYFSDVILQPIEILFNFVPITSIIAFFIGPLCLGVGLLFLLNHPIKKRL